MLSDLLSQEKIMFGLLISGRLVDTNFRQVDTTHAVIDVPDADSFNHVVVSTVLHNLKLLG